MIEVLERVVEEVKQLVSPKPEDRKLVEETASFVIDVLREELPRYGYEDCKVTLQGSAAKDTWLPENKEVDIFVILPKSKPREMLDSLVSVVIEIFSRRGVEWTVKYAQQAYV